MIELKVTVDAPELSVAINHLADAIESKGTDAPAAPVKNSRSKKVAVKTAPDAPAVSAPAHSEPVGSSVPVEQPAAVPQPVQVPVTSPVQQAIPATVAAPMMQQPVATAAPVMTPPAAPVTQQFIPQPAAAPAAPTQSQQGITCEQIINAAMPLMNSNPAFAMQLQGILAKYGVQAVTQIPENMLPNVAADLRALGAKI